MVVPVCIIYILYFVLYFSLYSTQRGRLNWKLQIVAYPVQLTSVYNVRTTEHNIDRLHPKRTRET